MQYYVRCITFDTTNEKNCQYVLMIDSFKVTQKKYVCIKY